jgi:hypothetical protein
MIEIILAYVAIGACIAIGGFVINYRPKSDFARAVDDLLHPNRSRIEKVKEALVIPVALLGVTFGWPIFIYMVFEGFWTKFRKVENIESGPKFATQGMYLKEKVSIHLVEAESIYADPLEAVPPIPFGHLNKGWKQFIEKIEDGDELWSFLIPKGALIGKYNFAAKEDMRGYSIVRDQKTIAEFIYEGSGGY